MLEAMRGDLTAVTIDPFDPKLCQYLIASMGSLPHEVLRILFLDGSRRLITDEQLQNGTLAQLAVYPRTIFKRALELNAAGIILVHNHPSGDAAPSEEDIRTTRLFHQIGRSLDIDIIDHIVVTASNVQHITGESQISGKAPRTSWFTLRGADAPAASTEDLALENARASIRRRLLRRQLIGAEELFGEPAWEMLIDLFIHGCERKLLSITSLCVTASMPMSSCLRLTQKLCDAGILLRVPDRMDGRRSFIRLQPAIAHRMRAYFEAGPE